MKKLLLILGILMVAACVLFLIFALLNLFAYRSVLDGSAELFERLRRRMTLCFTSGTVLAVIGAVCFIIRSKL